MNTPQNHVKSQPKYRDYPNGSHNSGKKYVRNKNN